jgi:MFS superfamily sulfate permease-like transporter
VDDRKELFALGLANIVGAFLGCFPTSSSLLRTKSFANAKIKTTLANGFFSGIFTLGVFIASSYLIYYLPKSADAAVVLMIAKGMIELSFFKETLKGRNCLEIFGSLFIILISFFLPLPYATTSVLVLTAASITYKLTDPRSIAKFFRNGKETDRALHQFLSEHSDFFVIDMSEFLHFPNASRLGRALKRRLSEKFIAQHSPSSLIKRKGSISEESLTEFQKERLILNFSRLDALDSATVGLLDHILAFQYLKQYSMVYILCHSHSQDLFKRLISPTRNAKIITQVDQLEILVAPTGTESSVIVFEG